MQDFALTFETEAQAVTALPEYRSQSEDGDQWTGSIIPNATRWIQRPVYDPDGNVITPAETVPGYHCIVRADANPSPEHYVADPGDIEPVFAGGWRYPVVPQEVQTLQALLAIDALGYSAVYESWANDPARTFAERAFRDKAVIWRRTNDMFNAFAKSQGFTEQDKDNFFILAATL